MKLNMDNNFDFYKDKRVFLTGHTGFKGTWMLFWLNKIGATVKGYALEPKSNDDLFNKVNGSLICDSVIGDIRNKLKLENEILKFKPDIIFHFAAQPLVRLSYEIPSETFEVNAIGTANLLEGVKKLDNPCTIIIITTDKVYENREWLYPYRESDALGGYDPYSASKACTELVVNSFRNSFFNLNNINNHGKSIATARAGNVIGGGDWSENRIVPDIVKAIINDQVIQIRNPNSIRPWQHVLEPIAGYLRLGQSLESDALRYSSSWNFGPNNGDEIKVEELVKIAIQEWGNGSYQIIEDAKSLHEAKNLRLDISKSIDGLNWSPKWSSKKAIEKTINFYKESLRNIDIDKLLIDNINEFEAS